MHQQQNENYKGYVQGPPNPQSNPYGMYAPPPNPSVNQVPMGAPGVFPPPFPILPFQQNSSVYSHPQNHQLQHQGINQQPSHHHMPGAAVGHHAYAMNPHPMAPLVPNSSQNNFMPNQFMPQRRSSEVIGSSDSGDHVFLSHYTVPINPHTDPPFVGISRIAKHSIQKTKKKGYIAAEPPGYVCYVSKTKNLKLMYLDGRAQVKLEGHEAEIFDIAFMPDYHSPKVDPTVCHIATLDASSKVIVWGVRFDQENKKILYLPQFAIGNDDNTPFFNRVFWFPATNNLPSQIVTVSDRALYSVRFDSTAIEKSRLYRFPTDKTSSRQESAQDILMPVKVSYIGQETRISRGKIIDVSLSMSGREFVITNSDSSVIYVDRISNKIINVISTALISPEQLTSAVDFSFDAMKSSAAEISFVTSSYKNTRLNFWKGDKCTHELRITNPKEGNEGENRILISNSQKMIILVDVISASVTLVKVDAVRGIFTNISSFQASELVFDIVPMFQPLINPDSISISWISPELISNYTINCVEAFNDQSCSIEVSKIPSSYQKIPKVTDLNRTSSDINVMSTMYLQPPLYPNYYQDPNIGIPPTPTSTPVVISGVKRAQADSTDPDHGLHLLRPQKSSSSNSILSSKPILMAPPGASMPRSAQLMNEDKSTVMSFASIGATGSLTHDSDDDNELSEESQGDDDHESGTQEVQIENEKQRNRHDIVEDKSLIEELKQEFSNYSTRQSKLGEERKSLVDEALNYVSEELKSKFEIILDDAFSDKSGQMIINTNLKASLENEIRNITKDIISASLSKTIKDIALSESKNIAQDFGKTFRRDLVRETQQIFLNTFEEVLIPQMEIEFKNGVLDLNNEDLKSLKECIKKGDHSNAFELLLGNGDLIKKSLKEFGDPSNIKFDKVDEQTQIVLIDKIRVHLGSCERILALKWIRSILKVAKIKNKWSEYKTMEENLSKWLNTMPSPNAEEKNIIKTIRQSLKAIIPEQNQQASAST